MLLKEDTPGPIFAVVTKTLDPNANATINVNNSIITHAPVVCNDNNAPTPIFSPINPTTDTHFNEEPDDENEDTDVYYEDKDYNDYEVE